MGNFWQCQQLAHKRSTSQRQEGCGANVNCVPHYGTQITGSGGTAAGFDVFTSTPSMKTYNYLTNNYDGVAGTQIPIYNQKGYFVFVRGDRSVITSTAPANSNSITYQRNIIFSGKSSSGYYGYCG